MSVMGTIKIQEVVGLNSTGIRVLMVLICMSIEMGRGIRDVVWLFILLNLTTSSPDQSTQPCEHRMSPPYFP